MKKLISFANLLLLGIVFFEACAGYRPPSIEMEPCPVPDIKDEQMRNSFMRKILAGCRADLSNCDGLTVDQAAEVNEFSTCLFRKEEKPYYTNSKSDWPDGLPQLCLAMSGGGLRSAATNIGVLQGLDDLGLLPKVDIMSSVSGGSYANYWFHANQLAGKRRAGQNPHELLMEGGEEQLALEKRGFVKLSADLWLLASSDFVFELLTRPVDLLLASPSTFNHDYQKTIDSTFRTGESGRWETPPRWSDFLAARPFPIINVTGTKTMCPSPCTLTAFGNAFELTPLRWGSWGIGFSLNDADDELVGPLAATSASGAVLDTPGPRCSVLSRLGLQLGVPVYPFYSGGRWGRVIHDWWSRMAQEEGKRPITVFLSDGGGIDNTGMISLVARLCRRIIAIDASAVPSAGDDPSCNSKHLLEDDLKVTPASNSFEQMATIVADELAPARLAIDKRAPSFVQMTLGDFPYPHSGALRLKIYYLRLGNEPGNRASLDKFLSDEGNKYGDVKQFLENIPTDTHFPNSPLIRQNFLSPEFRAYKALGRFLAHRYLSDLPAEIESEP